MLGPIVISIHTKHHSNSPNFTFPCAVQTCPSTFTTQSSLQCHMSRCHTQGKRELAIQSHLVNTSFVCRKSLCGKKLHSLAAFIKHLKNHISQGQESSIRCPFDACTKDFRKVSTFSSHLARKHKNKSAVSREFLMTSSL